MGEHQKIWTFGLITAVVRLDDTDCNTTPEVKGGAKKYLSQKEGEIELANCLIFAIWEVTLIFYENKNFIWDTFTGMIIEEFFLQVSQFNIDPCSLIGGLLL